MKLYKIWGGVVLFSWRLARRAKRRQPMWKVRPAGQLVQAMRKQVVPYYQTVARYIRTRTLRSFTSCFRFSNHSIFLIIPILRFSHT